jgi:hypothetical protein
MATGGMLPAGADVDWLIGTSTVLGAAETYLLVTRLSGGDLDQYEQWLATTWTRLAAASASPAAQG